ncbi:MAG: hypothetical protein CVU44_02970 [Chloroflexi bacterium HGW-Chloroflexi-6]|nr:MAG: hypothetical protein CVU44_02970 [Chloroflexi bacterium HGW-Chloroflexi-6]
MYNSAKSVFWKVVIIWMLFAFLHYANDMMPNPIFAFIGEKENAESIFSHSKMNFWTYLIVTVAEFFIFRKKILDVGQFWSTRLLSAVIYPWFALTFWMTGSALNGGAEPIRPIELSFALLSNVFGAYLTVRLEQIFDGVKFRNATRWTILVLFLMALIQYISFELQAPWWNYFGSN